MRGRIADGRGVGCRGAWGLALNGDGQRAQPAGYEAGLQPPSNTLQTPAAMGGDKPVVAHIAGIEVVTIPMWHYAELLECQRTVQLSGLRASQIRAHPAILAADPRSRLFADPEVCIFLYEICGRMKLPDAYSACCDRFGVDRSPSRATIGRYWQRVRRGP